MAIEIMKKSDDDQNPPVKKQTPSLETASDVKQKAVMAQGAAENAKNMARNSENAKAIMDEYNKKKNLLTPKRIYEVADSLDKEADNKRVFGAEQEKIAKAYLNKGESPKSKPMPGFNIPTHAARLDIAKKYKESADVDNANASRYRSLADKATGKLKSMQK